MKRNELNQNSRRSFIKNSAIGLAGVSLLTSNNSIYGLAKISKRKVGIALVGLGYYSTDILAPALLETKTAYLAGIVTGTPEKEKIWSEKYNIPKKNIYNYENFDEIVNNDEIDIVYIVLPNGMHKEFTIRAARAGKHVLCEKPMALNQEECREMIAECENNKVSLAIGYRLHYDPYNLEAMRIGQKEVFGRVEHISVGSAFRNSSTDHWKIKKALGGGAMMDMGVYPLQAARYVTGEEPISVSAQGFTLREEYKEIEEAVSFQLEFPSGTIAVCTAGFHASYDYLDVSLRKGHLNLRPYSSYRGLKGGTHEGPLNYPKMSQQGTQMDDMAESILAGKPMRVPGEEGLKDMIVVDAIYKSMENKCKIKL